VPKAFMIATRQHSSGVASRTDRSRGAAWPPYGESFTLRKVVRCEADNASKSDECREEGAPRLPSLRYPDFNEEGLHEEPATSLSGR